MATIVNPRYGSPRSSWRSRSSAICRRAGRVRCSCGSVRRSATVATAAPSGLDVTAGQVAAAGQRPAGSAEGRHGEDYRVELFVIPELGKVEPDRGGAFQAAGFDLLDEP